MSQSCEHPILGKTTRTLAVTLLLLAVPYASPRLRPLRVVPLATTSPSSALPPPLPTPTVGAQDLAASENQATVTNALPATRVNVPQGSGPVTPLAIEGTDALQLFYASLTRTDAKEPGAITRILHYGDSVIASDYVSGTVRRRLQERFGDAGHGFILMANAWRWYFHNDVSHYNSEGWEASRISGPMAIDGIYGIGGVSFRSYGGALAHFGTTTQGDYGRRVSRFDIAYLEQPAGGEFEVKVRAGPSMRHSTRGDKRVSRLFSVNVPDGEASISVRALSHVRMFGVSLERDTPGVTYSALGAHAAMASFWKTVDAAHLREQMTLHKPALVILQYGTNESDLWRIEWDEYETNVGALIDKIKTAAPGASVLVLAPLDRAERAPTGEFRTKPVILKLVEVQRRVARSKGVAFWNTFVAMGGEGSMLKWARVQPALGGGDLTHPTPLGAEALGNAFAEALVRSFEQAKAP